MFPFKSLLILISIMIIAALSLMLAGQAESQTSGKPKSLDSYNIIPKEKAKTLITLEGKEVDVIMIYQNQILYVAADDMMRVLGTTGSYDQQKGTYVINGKDFSKRKVFEAKNSSTGETVIFLPVDELLKFVGIRYTGSNLGEYPTVRIQTSSFSLPTPTPIPQKTGAVAVGTAQVTGTPTPSPQQVYSQKCNKCHGCDKVNGKSYSSADWANIVPRMAAKDPSWINNEEAGVITKYLSEGGR